MNERAQSNDATASGSPNTQQNQSNWLLNSDEIDLEENVDIQGEYWSMFGISDEKSDRKVSREYIYQSREQQTPSDIFGLRAPNERRSFLDRSVYISPYKKERTDQYGQSEKDPSIQSIDRMPSAELFNRPVFVKPLPESEETFSRPQVDFAPRVQIQRNNQGNNNRDLQRFIEQNRR